MKDYVSRIFGAWAGSKRLKLADSLLAGVVVTAGVAACGEAESEATPTPAATPTPLVTAPVMSPSPAPIPTTAPAPTPTATPQPTPTAQPVPRPVTPAPTPSSTSPTSTPTPTEPPAVAVEALAVTIIGVVLPEVGLNVRDAPSVDEGAVQYVALQDEELELTGETTEADGILWYQLADGNWVQGQYLEISERTSEAMPETTPEAAAPAIGCVIPEIGLNVRDAPSVTDGVVQYVALQGEELVLTGQTVEAEGAIWYEIEDGNWVQGQYLEIKP